MIDFSLMSHPIEEILRKAYAAFGVGDVDGYLAPCIDEFVFEINGNGGIAGTYTGKAGLYDLAGKAMSITGGTFHEDVEDVLANDDYAVVLVRHQFIRGGVAWDYQSAHLYKTADGKLVSCRELPYDAAQFDEAWGASPAASGSDESASFRPMKTPPVPVLIKK
jgi:uncharacterized protein